MNEPIQHDILRWSAAEEGPFFERKSALERSGGTRKPRKAAEIAHDIAETLAAFANADGGELVVGIEDDGTVSGVPHAEDKVRLLLGVPKDRNYVAPPIPCRTRIVTAPDGVVLLHFEADWSPNVHLLADSRCLRRVQDQNAPFDKDQVRALKDAKAQGLFERTFPAGARMEDLDETLLTRFAEADGSGPAYRNTLTRYRLTEGRNGHAVPTLAALLLFGRDPGRWHERAGIDFVRWEGKERKSGAELNIIKRFRVEAPLSVLPDKAFEAIKPFIRERQHLHDLFFVEKLEYPTFAWQEAVVNAVAHRDYSIRGMGIEVWMFDDRMEIRSPGLPPAPVTLEALATRVPMHCSRNPLLVRSLTVLRYMRELGEGVPRMFDEMERAGCYAPRFDAIGGAMVQVTLRNEPVYDRATLEWLKQFAGVELSGDQKRMLAYAHAHDNRFTSREYQKVVETDIYGASTAIKDMIRKGVMRSVEKGSRVYEIRPILTVPTDIPVGLKRLMRTLQGKGRVSNDDLRHQLGLSRYTAWRSLKDWTASGWILSAGSSTGRGRYYVPGPRLLLQAETSQNGTEAATMPTEAATIIPDGPLHQSPTAPVTRETDAMGLETDAMKGKD
jgi:ATP-dependent DNA helicase RecG